MSAGYSGTPLAAKLGIRAGDRVAAVRAPDGFRALLEPLPDGVAWLTRPRGRCDVIVAFTTRRAQLVRDVARLGPLVEPAGGLWIAWPKRSSGVATDVTEDTIREVALPPGRLVDTKVCAIDATWSGLRLVLRREHRHG